MKFNKIDQLCQDSIHDFSAYLQIRVVFQSNDERQMWEGGTEGGFLKDFLVEHWGPDGCCYSWPTNEIALGVVFVATLQSDWFLEKSCAIKALLQKQDRNLFSELQK